MTDTKAPDAESDAPRAPTRPQEYVADIGFEDLELSPSIRKALAEKGYTHPTPVQAKAFGPAMAGKDLIVRSKTGTGKTTAFGLPLLERIRESDKVVKALILCPTRELALQVAAELTELGKYKGIKVAAIYGGASMKQQEDALEEGSQIVVGTPGRVYDHIRRKTLKLDACSHAVLDEADEMLNQGFYEEVTRILDCLPKDRQVLLFSATVPTDIQNLIARYTTNAETLLLSGDVFTVDHIHHIRYDVSDAFPKPRNLIYVLETEVPEKAIVFCNTRDDTALVTAVLNRNGFDAELLNGDLPQKERERVMAKVKRGEVGFMVATDIAARGIDISDLPCVVNYSLPEDPAVYLHRVGRTGRIGKKGTAINLVSGRELTTFTTLEKKFNIKFEKKVMPQPEEAMRLWTERHVAEIKEAASGSVYEGMLPLAATLKSRPNADDLVAFLLRYFFTHHRMEKAKAEDPAGFAEREQREKEREERRFAEDRERRPRGEGRGERGGGRDRERSRDRGERSERPPRERAPRERAQGATSPADAANPTEPTVNADGAAVPSTEGAPKRERRPRERKPRETTPVPEGQVRFWVNLGQTDSLDEGAIKSALEGMGVPAGVIQKIEVRGSYSYAFAEEAKAADLEALNGKSHGGKTVKIERAKRQ